MTDVKNLDLSLNEARRLVEDKLAEDDKAALEYLMADKRGRWFFMRLCECCHILNSTFPNEGDVNRLLVYEGERRVALNILANIANLGEKALADKQLAEREYHAEMAYHAQILRAGEEYEKEWK